MMQNYRNNRILIVDDNEAIHADFRKILGGERAIQKDETASAQDAAFDSLRSRLFGSPQAPRSPALEFEMDSAYQGEEAVEKVRTALTESRPYAMAFVDMRMPPGIGGVETIEKIWKQDPNVQIVICTAYSDESWDDLQARFGRLDRLLILKKPFDVVEASQLACALTEKWRLTSQMLAHRDELEKAVESRTNELQVANEALLREIEQREAAEEKLRYDAFHDNLTGLPNRAHLLEQLRARITRFSAGGNNSTFALLFVDLDNFKIINDSLGHRIGDILLMEVAERMTTLLGGLEPSLHIHADGIARLGGDEFVAILDGITCQAEVSAVVEELHKALSQPYHVTDRDLNITASIGVAIFRGDYDANELLRNADTAMYRAKHAGKARHAVFNDAMHADAMARLELENALRLALDRGEFRVVYQPIISVESGRISGFEALLRWEHPTRGTIWPGEFIEVAEELGAIVRIGHWVLEQACRQLAIWKRLTSGQGTPLSISVNVSKRQLEEPHYCGDVERIIAETGIDANDLNLEVTESAIIGGVSSRSAGPGVQLEHALSKLRSMNIGLHVDDFGTGYSSLSILHRYPFSALKIDRSFICGMTENRSFAAIVHAITTLARNLKMKVTAEGVEHPDHLPPVLAMDCSYIQGFLFSEPVDADAASQLLLREPCWRNLTQPGAADVTSHSPETAYAPAR